MGGPIAQAQRARWNTVARILLAVLGGYLLANWSMACLALGLTNALDMQRGDAVILASLLGFPTYVAAIIRAISAQRLGRALAEFAGLILVSLALAHRLGELGPVSIGGH